MSLPDQQPPPGPWKPPLVSVKRDDPTKSIWVPIEDVPPVVIDDDPIRNWDEATIDISAFEDKSGGFIPDAPIAPVVDLEPPETEEQKHKAGLVAEQLVAARRARAHLEIEMAKVNAMITALESM